MCGAGAAHSNYHVRRSHTWRRGPRARVHSSSARGHRRRDEGAPRAYSQFGKQILSQQISGWSAYYLDYKFLKKVRVVR